VEDEAMSDHELAEQIRKAPPAEPLSSVEKKLIGWSLGLGAGLLVVLYVLTRAL